ncbi:hypothetical protein ACPCIX_24970 [Streptomyces pseudogriseolus]|uniref:hypothetical protein n=1 Tax=Streptomyces TaxID=1883 RepID=UPI0018FEAB48|nr:MULTISPECIES: hypothetical protein [Streptomyces]
MSDEEAAAYYTLTCDDPPHEVVLVDCGSREMDVILAMTTARPVEPLRSSSCSAEA